MTNEFTYDIPTDLVELGTVIDAYGIRGALKIRPFADDPVALLGAKEVWIRSPRDHAELKNYQVYKSRNHSGTVLMELVGITDREFVLRLKSAEILVSRKLFPSLSEDEYYWSDLIGLEVVNRQHQVLGKVIELMDNGVQSVLVLEDDVKKQRLIPFVDPYIIEVSLTGEMHPRIMVDWEADW